MTPAVPSSSQTVLTALHTLYHDPDSASKRRASEWLEEFQHSLEAWQICHDLLTAEGSPLEGRLFSAQTLRAKILYDLAQLPREQLPPLRDSLLSSLSPLSQPTAPTGSKAVIVQLCLALSDLALQMPEWKDVVGGMIDLFGKDPSTVGILLGFLKTLVEEAWNPRIPLSSEQAKDTLSAVISGNAEPVLNVLTMYIQASGVTPSIQNSVFETLSSWINAGEIVPTQIVQTPLFEAAFQALPSDQLFDAAVDVLCDLIHETQEVEDNMEVVQQIVPRVVELRSQLEVHKEDPDRIRGYCRILCEAGECYKDLIVRHPDQLISLVESISACAAYPDLEIVPITFNFWYNLATTLGRQPPDPQYRPILQIYANLQSVIIGHLQFPGDNEQQTAQERDEFRVFRHRMGDTLKDCCHVLGASTCLQRSYDMVTSALSQPSPSWQEIEAPLFSMRSMGAQVDPEDDEILPQIMDMLPKLPDHPRIRYAAILVISRYTQWIDRHPENLAFQLQYISAGFDMAEEEVSAAAAQAMKFMCQDCNQHLVPFLPQLHAFITTVGDKLDQADMVEVCEAIGYVILSMEAEQAAAALRQFCEPLIAKVQIVANSETEAQKQDLQRVADALEQMDSYLVVVRTLNPVPESCYPTALAVYQLLDSLLIRYAKVFFISERVGSILRRGLGFFPPQALQPLVQPVMERMARSFEMTGYASYLWIIGKVAQKFASDAQGPGGEGLAGLLGGSFDSVTASLGELLSKKVAVEVPDVMDDYVHCFMAYLNSLPNLTISLSRFQLAISHVLAALNLPAPETILISLDVLGMLSRSLSTPDHLFQSTLQPIFALYGKVITSLMIDGVVTRFPEDSLDHVQDILGATLTRSGTAPEVVEGWVTEAIQALPGYVVPQGERVAFLTELHAHLLEPGTDRLKNAVNNLVRAARRARERGRQSRKSLGTGMD